MAGFLHALLPAHPLPVARQGLDQSPLAHREHERVPLIVAQLGRNVDPFILHIYAALAEKERAMISERTRDAFAKAKQRGVVLGNPKCRQDEHRSRCGSRCQAKAHS